MHDRYLELHAALAFGASHSPVVPLHTILSLDPDATFRPSKGHAHIPPCCAQDSTLYEYECIRFKQNEIGSERFISV
jgi:hypothetical protein